jgi:hypothetical protein
MAKKGEQGYTQGNYGSVIPEEADITPGRKNLGPEGIHYGSKELLERDTARIAEAAADHHEHHKAKHHKHSRGRK